MIRSLALAALLAAPSAFAQPQWPDLSAAPAVGGGEKDAAVVVGLENYAAVAPIPGALKNAADWHAYLTGTLGVPLDRVALLRDNEATLETLRDKARDAAASVQPGGTLWFVFIGHGAPTKDGKDGLLVGWDAQQNAASLFSRSLPQKELLRALAAGKQARTVVLIDACFSGRTPEGAPLIPGLQPLIVRTGGVGAALATSRAVILTAARSDQFAGPLPGAGRPAFSYLALGGLRGWAAGPDGKVTAEGLAAYVAKTLRALQVKQQPELTAFAAGQVLATGRESGPDVGALVRETPPAPARSGSGFQLTALPAVPRAVAPKSLDAASVGLDLGSVDVDALEKYELATRYEKSAAAPDAKAENWRALGKLAPQFAAVAEKRAAAWDEFAAKNKVVEEALDKRREARDADWSKLSRLLALSVVPESDKKKWSAQFAQAYLRSPGLEEESVKALAAHLAPGPLLNAVKKAGAGSVAAKAAAAAPIPDSFADLDRKRAEDAERRAIDSIKGQEGAAWKGDVSSNRAGNGTQHNRRYYVVRRGSLQRRWVVWYNNADEPSPDEGALVADIPIDGRRLTYRTTDYLPSCNPVTIEFSDDFSTITESVNCPNGTLRYVYTR